MAQIIHAYVRKTSRPKQGLEVSPDKPRLMNRTSQVRCEDQISELAFGWLGPFLQFAKKGNYLILELDHAPATFSFCVFKAPCSFLPLERFRNANRAAPEIKVRPSERKVLARAHTGCERERK